MAAVKWLYLARRASQLARADFPRVWKGHARLAGRFPDLAGFFEATLYCVADEGSAFDAIGILALRDLDAIRSVVAHPDAIGTMHPDELRVFEDLIARLSLAAEEEVLIDGAAGGHLALLLLDRDAPELPARLAAAIAPEAAPSRCVVNHVVDGVFPTRHRAKAVVELHYRDPGAMRTAVAAADALADLGPVTTVQGSVILNWSAHAAAVA